MMEGEAEHWWDTKERALGTEVEQLSWEDFKEVFYDKYFSQFVQDQKEEKFLRLVHRTTIVAQYEAIFTELSHFASHFFLNDYKKSKMSLKGLRQQLRAIISTTLPKSYLKVVEKALVAEKSRGSSEWQGTRQEEGSSDWT